jgi:hypothetical protein
MRNQTLPGGPSSAAESSRDWPAKDWAVDVVDEYVQAQATGAVFDRPLDPALTS